MYVFFFDATITWWIKMYMFLVCLCVRRAWLSSLARYFTNRLREFYNLKCSLRQKMNCLDFVVNQIKGQSLRNMVKKALHRHILQTTGGNFLQFTLECTCTWGKGELIRWIKRSEVKDTAEFSREGLPINGSPSNTTQFCRFYWNLRRIFL